MMLRLRANLFETLHVSTPDGSPLDLGSPTTRSLIAYLLLNRTRPIDRRRLAFLFWPRVTESAARRNLRQYLHHIRAAFEPVSPGSGLLIASGSTLQFNSQVEIWLDVEAFQRGTRPEASLAEVESALALYTGDLLEDIYDDWCIPERERLRQLHLNTLNRFSQALQSVGRFEDALTYARLWVSAEPFDEKAHRLLMTLYAESGDRARAIQRYQSLAQSLEEELGAQPLPETQALLHAIQSGDLHFEAEAPIQLVSSPRGLPRPRYPAPSCPLVGRQMELARLDEILEQARAGAGRLVLITGEAGIGKTRLVQEYLDRQTELITLNSVCYELESMVSFAPLRQALENSPLFEQWLATLRPPPPWLMNLIPILPVLTRRFLYHTPSQSSSDGNALRESLIHLIIYLSRQITSPPLHLILDDMHWADTSTWELLAALARRAMTTPLVIISLCRVEDLPAEQRPLLRAIERSDLLLTFPLPRLNLQETADLAAQLTSGSPDSSIFLKRLYQDTEGNPFFIIETVRAMQEDSPVRRPFPSGISLPHSIQQIIEARLDRLPAGSRETLASAAAIGRSFTFTMLQEINQVSTREIISHIEEWQQRGLVHETQNGYDFLHDKFRQVAYLGLGRARREYIHRRIADVLKSAIPAVDAATLAHHYARSDQPLKALPYLTNAGEQALRLRSYREARQFGLQAVNLLGQMPGPRQRSERVDVNLQLAQAYAFTGDLRRALEILDETEHLAMTLGDEARLGRIFRRSAQFFWLNGQPEVASDYARRTLRLAEELEDPELLYASLRMLGRVSIALAAFDDAIAYLMRYVNIYDDLVTSGGNARLPEDLPIVLGYLGVSYSRVGAWERALSSAGRGLSLALAAVDDGELDATTIFARMQLAMIHVANRAWEECLDVLAPIPQPHEEDISPPLYMVLSLRGYARAHMGEIKEGLGKIRAAIGWAERTGHRVFHYVPRLFLAEVLLLDGDHRQGMTEVEAALAESRRTGNRWASGIAHKLLADAHFRQPAPDWTKIENNLIESMHLLRQVRARPDLARTYLSLRRLYDRAGQIAWAVDCHFRATTIFDELGMVEELRLAQGQAAGDRRGAVVIPNLPLRGPNIPEDIPES